MDRIARISFSGNSIRILFESGLSIPLPVTIEYSSKYSVGDSLDEAEILELKKKSEKHLCRDKALRYIANPHTESQIRVYLKKKEFSNEAIKDALVFLKKMNYIDDEAYAKRYLNNMLKRKVVGRKYAENKLKQTGVDKVTIERVIREESLLFDNIDALYEFACKKYESISGKKNCYAKLVYALNSRGFSSSDIFAVLGKMKNSGYTFENNMR
ncbi:MAG: RecX family transcriptional regulator [Spirochaetes bacterium]|nr:RecX family transcriptional regulator [Spirochaetota bacterium]MBN2770204.1 RecX family transcriptional regulator [Spirochaetota bacterium]